ncbi:MAG TPA: carboxylating nicotinate-nucleotide diphosphorylase [Acidimicrobiales bacterium]|nr:carboxylating nicotinate-nucleotide diphosphorylase [Acidimicrobiales bacterium]
MTPDLRDTDGATDAETATHADPAALAEVWPTTGGVDPPVDAVRAAVASAIAEDVGPAGDLTAMLVAESEVGRVRVVSRAEGVLAGRLCALAAFSQIDRSIEVDWQILDGGWLEPGSVVAEVSGSMRSILTAERTALNFLCHLSGIATRTRRFVDAVTAANPATRVLDTRKTTPGLRVLEKAAVRAGGGWNHRAGLSDAVLVKDNHLGRLGITQAVTAARRSWPGLMVEVECDRPEQVSEAVAAGASAVLLDNMTPSLVSECVALVRAARAPGIVLVEASGGVTLDSAPAFAAAGADLISVGSITHSAPILDLGLDLVED